jgi:hypothetical protein
MTIYIQSSSYPNQIDNPVNLLIAENNLYTSTSNYLNSGWENIHGDDTQHIEVYGISSFPTAGGYISIDNEIMYYCSTSVSASVDVLHIPSQSRALFGSSGSSHDSASRVESRIIAEYHNRHSQAILNIENTIGSLPNGIPINSSQSDASKANTNYFEIDSGSGIIRSGTLEDRINYLEWAIFELFSSSYFESRSMKLSQSLWQL